MQINFKLVSEIEDIETIAEGKGIRDRRQLEKLYGKGSWKKKKGLAAIEIETGEVLWAELHWYECHGRGRVRMRIKRFLL